MFTLPEYKAPDLSLAHFLSCPDVTTQKAGDGYIPENFYATTIYPEYFKINGEWVLLEESRMDCSVVIRSGKPYAVEMRNIKSGDDVVVGRRDDGSCGVYVNYNAFDFSEAEDKTDTEDGAFSFRSGKSRETSFSRDYDRLYSLLEYERSHSGYIVWVLGPACVFDYDARRAMSSLINNGYCNALFAGNALATHDLEGAIFNTALGQEIYSKKSVKNGHYNHLHTINLVRRAGGIEQFIKQNNIDNGVMSALVRNSIPYVLAGSIRDDGPLPDVKANVYQAQDAMREHIRKATTVIALATQLHTIATGNMTPAYRVVDSVPRPVYFYVVDAAEFAVNKLHDRGSLSSCGIVTNIQDFLVITERNLIK